jgi:hypothetical protein
MLDVILINLIVLILIVIGPNPISYGEYVIYNSGVVYR